MFVCMSESEIIDVCLCTVPIPIPLERDCLLKWLISNKVYDCFSFCLVHLKIFFFYIAYVFILRKSRRRVQSSQTTFFFKYVILMNSVKSL